MTTLQAPATSESRTERSRNFTIHHGFLLSLALHASLAIPVLLHRLHMDDDEQSPLVFEMDGLVSDEQADEKLQKDTAGPAQQNASQTSQAKKSELTERLERTDDGSRQAKSSEVAPPAPAPAKSNPGAQNVQGAEEQQIARTISRRPESDDELIRAYVRLLSKRVHSRLIYPEEGRQAGLRGVAKVSFGILSTGQIRPDTLKIVASSGQSRLDASALQTIRSSAPFGPPPREINVAIDVVFGPSR